MVRWQSALAILALAGCSEPTPTRAALVENVPAEAKVPACDTLAVSESSQTQVGQFTAEMVEFRASAECIEKWAASLGKGGGESGIVLIQENPDGSALSVSRPGYDPELMRISWTHDGTRPARINDNISDMAE